MLRWNQNGKNLCKTLPQGVFVCDDDTRRVFTRVASLLFSELFKKLYILGVTIDFAVSIIYLEIVGYNFHTKKSLFQKIQ